MIEDAVPDERHEKLSHPDFPLYGNTFPYFVGGRPQTPAGGRPQTPTTNVDQITAEYTEGGTRKVSLSGRCQMDSNDKIFVDGTV